MAKTQGQYYGTDILSGSDEYVAQQVAAIDKQRASSNLASRYAPAAPAPTPTAPAAPAPETGLVRSPIQLKNNPLDAMTEKYFGSLQTPQDLETIRKNTRAAMQGFIDTVNVQYDRQKNTQLDENANMNARTRGVNLSAGLQGSDFASAAASGTEKKGNKAVDLIEQERSAKIGAVLSQTEDRAQKEFEFQRSEARQNLHDYVAYYTDRQKSARTDLDTLAKTGVSLDQLTDDEYQKLLDQTGFDDFTLKATYNAAKQAAHKIDYKWQINGKKIFGYGLDPVTNKVSTLEQELPFDVPTDYKPQFLDNGTMIFYPENIDPSKPIKDQILTYETGSPNDSKNLREVRGGLYNTRTQKWVINPKADEGDTDVILQKDLQDAAAAIESGADAQKVRQRFLDSHPTKGDLYLKYTKSEY